MAGILKLLFCIPAVLCRMAAVLWFGLVRLCLGLQKKENLVNLKKKGW